MNLKHRVDDFLGYLASFTGTKPKLQNGEVLWAFHNDLSRDIILLGVAETCSRASKL